MSLIGASRTTKAAVFSRRFSVRSATSKPRAELHAASPGVANGTITSERSWGIGTSGTGSDVHPATTNSAARASALMGVESARPASSPCVRPVTRLSRRMGSCSAHGPARPRHAPRGSRRERGRGRAHREGAPRARDRARRGGPALPGGSLDLRRRHGAPPRGRGPEAFRRASAPRGGSGPERREPPWRDRSPLRVRSEAVVRERPGLREAAEGDRAPDRRRLEDRARREGRRRAAPPGRPRPEPRGGALSPRARSQRPHPSREAALDGLRDQWLLPTGTLTNLRLESPLSRSSQTTWARPPEISSAGCLEAPSVIEMSFGSAKDFPPSEESAMQISGFVSCPVLSRHTTATAPSRAETAGWEERPPVGPISRFFSHDVPPSRDSVKRMSHRPLERDGVSAHTRYRVPESSTARSGSVDRPRVLLTSSSLEKVFPPSVDVEKKMSGIECPESRSAQQTWTSFLGPQATRGCQALPRECEMFVAVDQVAPLSVESACQISGPLSLSVVSAQTTWTVPSGAIATDGSMDLPGVRETSK